MNERDLEKTEELQGMLTDAGVQQIRNKLPPKGTIGPEHCVDCDSLIPPKRRLHGFDLCVNCAHYYELRMKR